jgi:dCTP diphosphatase
MYSEATGITKSEGQSIGHKNSGPSFTIYENLPRLTTMLRNFRDERGWEPFDKPRNLLLALIGELGELAEIFQWKGDTNGVLTNDDIDKIGQELADVTIYLIRLADACSMSLHPW